MKFQSITPGAVAVLALSFMSACSGAAGGGGNAESARDRVTTEAVAQTIAPIFSVSGAPALRSKHSSSACLEEDVSEEGLSLSNDVPEGHYGLADEGIEFSSDASCAETGFVHWELDDMTGEDCAGDEMEVSGEGVFGIGTTDSGETVVIVLGTFEVEGLEVTCDIMITDDSFEASCETDGEALETDSCGVTDETDEETDDESDDESGEDSGYGYDDESDSDYDDESEYESYDEEDFE